MPRTKKTVINPNEPEKQEAMTTASTVLVAYNGPQAQRFEIPMANGSRKKVIINGNNHDLIGKPIGKLCAGGYGLTAVDKEAWDWIKTNYANWGPIKNGLMFASDEDHVNDEIKARKDLKNGFEPLKKDSISGVTAKEKA